MGGGEELSPRRIKKISNVVLKSNIERSQSLICHLIEIVKLRSCLRGHSYYVLPPICENLGPRSSSGTELRLNMLMCWNVQE